jgi:PTH1 family peptidyl-tRNA hydrolase
MHLVVGLGNPGAKYHQTRHNIGFEVVDCLSKRWAAPCATKQFGALVGKAKVGGASAMFAKPQSFMNRSGQPVVSLKGYYRVASESVVVVHDDLDIPFGQLRVKNGGGHGGHNGLRDIKRALGGQEFVRVRCGVSRPPEGWDTANYVLGRWSSDEQATLSGVVDKAADAAECILAEGVVVAMNRFNVRSAE